jgi:hypothetical protein
MKVLIKIKKGINNKFIKYNYRIISELTDDH